jgi:hypothetical protein
MWEAVVVELLAGFEVDTNRSVRVWKAWKRAKKSRPTPLKALGTVINQEGFEKVDAKLTDFRHTHL